VTNPFDFTITVRTLTVGVSPASPACGANNLAVQPLPGPLAVAPRGSARVALDVTLANDSSNACQGATWPLAFTAQATPSASSPSGGAAGGSPGSSNPSGGNVNPSGGSSGSAGGNNGASNGGGGLAFTGANLWTVVVAGLIALAAGLGLILLGRQGGPRRGDVPTGAGGFGPPS
jgi:hypothetical protein